MQPARSPSVSQPGAGLTVAAFAWLGLVRVVLWLLPFARTRFVVAWAARVLPSSRRDAAPDPRAVGSAVEWAARAVPRASCLVQGLAAQVLLQRRGMPAELHLGASRDAAGDLAAHAWLECDGRVVVGEGPGPHTPLGVVDWPTD